jgi:hypothetical protein
LLDMQLAHRSEDVLSDGWNFRYRQGVRGDDLTSTQREQSEFGI